MTPSLSPYHCIRLQLEVERELEDQTTPVSVRIELAVVSRSWVSTTLLLSHPNNVANSWNQFVKRGNRSSLRNICLQDILLEKQILTTPSFSERVLSSLKNKSHKERTTGALLQYANPMCFMGRWHWTMCQIETNAARGGSEVLAFFMSLKPWYHRCEEKLIWCYLLTPGRGGDLHIPGNFADLDIFYPCRKGSLTCKKRRMQYRGHNIISHQREISSSA